MCVARGALSCRDRGPATYRESILGSVRSHTRKVPSCKTSRTRGVHTRPMHGLGRQAGGRWAGGPEVTAVPLDGGRCWWLRDTVNVRNADLLALTTTGSRFSEFHLNKPFF